MAVYKYVNGAWQETSETPKKYVSGAWEDTDGYAYENGAWVQKWSKFPQNYIVYNGVVNPKYTMTQPNSADSVNASYRYGKMTYNSSEGCLDFNGQGGNTTILRKYLFLLFNLGSDLLYNESEGRKVMHIEDYYYRSNTDAVTMAEWGFEYTYNASATVPYSPTRNSLFAYSKLAGSNKTKARSTYTLDLNPSVTSKRPKDYGGTTRYGSYFAKNTFCISESQLGDSGYIQYKIYNIWLDMG